jgi:hypothetical protein
VRVRVPAATARAKPGVSKTGYGRGRSGAACDGAAVGTTTSAMTARVLSGDTDRITNLLDGAAASGGAFSDA